MITWRQFAAESRRNRLGLKNHPRQVGKAQVGLVDSSGWVVESFSPSVSGNKHKGDQGGGREMV